ncbi:MAG: histone deacetylase family protein [Pseudomonadota bacterium]
MTTALISHPICLEHQTPLGHPECPDRLRAVLAALERETFTFLHRIEAPIGDIETVALAHPRAHVDQLLARVPPPDGPSIVPIDGDTNLSPASGEAALRGVGGLVRAVDGVVSGEFSNAFCAVRPPGHHAERERAMGFCLFNSVAIAALHAREVHGLKRAAVVDFDVHHGNGTQDIFERDPDLFFASTHQWPLYPGTGSADERGVAGNILNVPLAPGSTGLEFQNAMAQTVLPALEAFHPDIIFISAGFDAHAADPLAHLRLREADFAWATAEILKVADRVCSRRVVSTLEGGYDLPALAASAAAHVEALMTAG